MLDNNEVINIPQEQINAAVKNFMEHKFTTTQLKEMVQTVNTHDSYTVVNKPATNKYDIIGKIVGDIAAAVTLTSLGISTVKVINAIYKNKLAKAKKED